MAAEFANPASAAEQNHFSSPSKRAIIMGMKELTAIVHRGEPGEGGFWATCLEVPGANGQGETKEECLQNLKEAIQVLLRN
jgi:hypothetical protein